MATLTGKADIIQWLPDAAQPKTQFLGPREPRLSLSTHTTLPGGVVSSIGQVSAASPKDKAWQRLWHQVSLEPYLFVFPNRMLYIFTDTAPLWEPWPVLGNEVCLWGNLMDPVVCWVGWCFIIADGHLMSAKLSPFSSQTNIQDLCGISSEVFWNMDWEMIDVLVRLN